MSIYGAELCHCNYLQINIDNVSVKLVTSHYQHNKYGFLSGLESSKAYLILQYYASDTVTVSSHMPTVPIVFKGCGKKRGAH